MVAALLPAFGCGEPKNPATPDAGVKTTTPALPATGWHPDVPRGPVVAGPKVRLRFARNRGKVDVYEGKFELREEGPAHSTENADLYLSVFTVGTNAQGLDQICLRRTHTKRRREEKYPNTKTRVDDQTRDDMVNLGSNFDVVAGMRTYAFDDRGRCAWRADEKGRDIPHLIHYDSFHFFFPMLSKKEVQPGDTWKSTIPMAIPTPLVGTSGLAPTGIYLNYAAKLRSIADREGRKIATIEYDLDGEFDSSAPDYKDRFAEDFRRRQRVYHRVEAGGTCELDIEAQRIVSKTEAMHVVMTTEALIVEGTKTRNSVTTIQVYSKMALKWLPPGTVLSTGVRVPE